MWTHTNPSESTKRGPRPGWCCCLLPRLITKMFCIVFLCTRVTLQLTLSFRSLSFFVGLLPVLKWDPGGIPRPKLSRTEKWLSLVTVINTIKYTKRYKEFKLKRWENKERQKGRERRREGRQEGDSVFILFLWRTDCQNPWLTVGAIYSAGRCSSQEAKRKYLLWRCRLHLLHPHLLQPIPSGPFWFCTPLQWEMTPLGRSSGFQDCSERKQERHLNISKVQLLRVICTP